MVKLTVGLPMFRARYIGWLALEALCRQEKPGCDWELIIAEEADERHLPVGLKEIEKYTERLKQAGCVSVKYIKVEDHIPLFKKWCLIASNSAKTSDGFIIQAADAYCGAKRLKQAEKYFGMGAKHIYSTIHQIYNLHDGNIYVLRAKNVETAYDIRIFRTLKPYDRYTKVDGAIYAQLKNVISDKIIVDKTDYWKSALTIHGLNNISSNKRIVRAQESGVKLESIIPSELINRLIGCKKYIKTWRRKVWGKKNQALN